MILDLSGRDWTEVPADHLTHPSIDELSLDRNPLTALPGAIRQLPNLRFFSAYHNRREAAPDWLWDLTKLESLNLSVNQIGEISERLCRPSQLHTLDLVHNRIERSPPSPARPPQP